MPPRSLPFFRPVRLYALLSSRGCARSFAFARLSIHPSLVAVRTGFRLFLHVSVSLSSALSHPLALFLSVPRFLSLLRIYRGEQRMWMGWVSPRLGERSITCEPKREEIRGCAAVPTGTKRSASRNGGILRNTRAVCPTPLSLSPSVHPSIRTYVRMRLFRGRSPFFLSALSLRPSRVPASRVPVPYARNDRGLSIIIALRARAP